jgi:hypothetical protein
LHEVFPDKRVITIDGVSYLPLALAAWIGQTTPTTLRRWIGHNAVLHGRRLDIYRSLDDEIYLSAQSVTRLANRFVKWPSKAPAPHVTIGLCDDRMGFLGLQETADYVGVLKQTLWQWANNGETPWKNLFDVIKCQVSDHLYIRQRDADMLRAVVTRSFKRRPRQRPFLSEAMPKPKPTKTP